MVDNIIIHLHYIRLGDDMDLFFFFSILFPELFPHVFFSFVFGIVFFFVSCFVEAQCFEHLKKKKKIRNTGIKQNTQSDRFCKSINQFSFFLSHSLCTAIFFFFFLYVLFAQKACLLHQRSFTFISLCVLYFAVSMYVSIVL
jgi:hypothetical protein